jgi:3-hydroxyisobutyrate dehydrogenase
MSLVSPIGSSPVLFVGLGQMGSALAKRLIGHTDLTVCDRSEPATAPFRDAGIAVLDAADVPGGHFPVVMTCLPTTDMVEALLFDGTDALAPRLPSSAIVIDMSTGHPDIARRMACRLTDLGMRFADVPVSGGPQAADAGTIAMMAGCAEDLFTLIRPLLTHISPNSVWMGPVGSGSAMKLVNNMLAAANRLAGFEAVAIGVSQGLDPRACINVINKSSGRNNSTEVTFPRHIFTEQLEQNFKLGLSLKDVRLAATMVPPVMEPIAVSTTLVRILDHAAGLIGEGQDINAIIRLYEQAAGHPIAHRAPAG